MESVSLSDGSLSPRSKPSTASFTASLNSFCPWVSKSNESLCFSWPGASESIDDMWEPSESLSSLPSCWWCCWSRCWCCCCCCCVRYCSEFCTNSCISTTLLNTSSFLASTYARSLSSISIETTLWRSKVAELRSRSFCVTAAHLLSSRQPLQSLALEFPFSSHCVHVAINSKSRSTVGV